MLRWLGSGAALALLATLALPLVPSTANAQAAPGFGVVDTRRAIVTCKAGMDAQKGLNSLMEKKQEQFGSQEEEVKKLQQEFDSQKFVLAQEALEERRIEIARKKSKLERAVEEAREEMAVAERKAFQPLLTKVEALLKEIGQEKGLMMIMERNTPGIVYSSETLDITDVLIERLNKS
jgi:Skp family chaperone for outer membrane proteins